MRAQQLVRPNAATRTPLVDVEIPRPTPARDEVLIAVSACAVCRTDLQLAEGDIPARHLPITPGHQVVGRIVDAGDAAARAYPAGTRVGVAWLAATCGTCARCVEGRENLCEHARFTGWDRDGGFAEYVTARADFVFPIPDDFGDLDAAPLLCGGVIGYRSLKIAGVKPGQKLGLFGFGASALLVLQIARHWDCRVFVATRSASERERALAMGAEWAGAYEDVVPERLDAAITFAPVGSVVVAALRALDRGGTVAINAIHLDGIPAFPYEPLWLERSIRSVANFTRADARELLDLARTLSLRTSTDVFPLADANAALAALAKGQVHGAAVLDVRRATETGQ